MALPWEISHIFMDSFYMKLCKEQPLAYLFKFLFCHLPINDLGGNHMPFPNLGLQNKDDLVPPPYVYLFVEWSAFVNVR